MPRKRRSAQIIVLAALALSAACQRADTETPRLVLQHLERHPAAELPDVYSLLFHGALGPAHGAIDSTTATTWLAREVAALEAGPAEPIAEPIRGDSSVLRVNIRPFLAAGGTEAALLDGFLATGREVTPDDERLDAAMDALVAMAERGEVPWPVDSVRAFADRVGRQDHPVMSHSAAYLEAYRPSYRILSRDRLRDALPAGVDPFAAPLPPFPTGAFVDDYDGAHTVSAEEWRQGSKARYRIVAWHPTRHYLVAQNDSANPTDGGRWMRIDWVTLPDMAPWTWAFCFSAYNAPTAAAAESTTVARPDTPRTGCNGFPYSRLRAADR